MKRILTILLAFSLLISSAAADPLDLSGLSFGELVALRDRLNLAIWQSSEWQEVTVPAGIWTIGQDIPAGHWTIKALPGTYVSVTYFDRLDQFGTGVGRGWLGWGGTLSALDDNDDTKGERSQVDIDMTAGMYFRCTGTVIFTPYAGKPDLGFK